MGCCDQDIEGILSQHSTASIFLLCQRKQVKCLHNNVQCCSEEGRGHTVSDNAYKNPLLNACLLFKEVLPVPSCQDVSLSSFSKGS